MKFKDWWGKEHSLPKNKKFSWRPSAYALIIKGRRILLIKSKLNGMWECPGGGIDLDEEILEGLGREVYEESSCKITVKDKRPLYVGDNYFFALNKNEYFHTIPMIFLASLKSAPKNTKPKDNEEVAEIAWFHFDKLPRPTNPMVMKAIKEYKK